MFKYNTFYNKKDVEFIPNQKFVINEDNAYVPRFSLKDVDIFKDIPVNKQLKPNKSILIKAIKYGMVMQIQYKGKEDKLFKGHSRVIYPMCLGRSSKGKFLLRGFHLNGWSVSKNRTIDKVWRLFRLDRLLSISFTGSFYRLPPDGYNEHDKGMKGGIIAAANFSRIRKNQQSLLNKQKIQDKDEVSLDKDDKKFASIKASKTNTELDITNSQDNEYISNVKDLKNLRISFLKSLYGKEYIAILGAIGKPGNVIKLIDKDTNKSQGTFKVIDSTTGDVLKKVKNVKGNKFFDLWIFDKKL